MTTQPKIEGSSKGKTKIEGIINDIIIELVS